METKHTVSPASSSARPLIMMMAMELELMLTAGGELDEKQGRNTAGEMNVHPNSIVRQQLLNISESTVR